MFHILISYQLFTDLWSMSDPYWKCWMLHMTNTQERRTKQIPSTLTAHPNQHRTRKEGDKNHLNQKEESSNGTEFKNGFNNRNDLLDNRENRHAVFEYVNLFGGRFFRTMISLDRILILDFYLKRLLLYLNLFDVLVFNMIWGLQILMQIFYEQDSQWLPLY